MKKVVLCTCAIIMAIAIHADVNINMANFMISGDPDYVEASEDNGVVTVNYDLFEWGAGGVEYLLPSGIGEILGIDAEVKLNGTCQDEQWVALMVYLEDEDGVKFYNPAPDLHLNDQRFADWYSIEQYTSDEGYSTLYMPNEEMWGWGENPFASHKPFVKVGIIANAMLAEVNSFSIRNLIIRTGHDTVTIDTKANYPERGKTYGDTVVASNSDVVISASASYGYHFTKWSDGNTQNPRHITAQVDATYTAQFDKNTYFINLITEETQGWIDGATSALYLNNVTLTAQPAPGYHFVKWSDGNTTNPRSFVITKDTTFEAQFAISHSGTCGNNLTWSYSNGRLTIAGSGPMYNTYNQINQIPWWSSWRDSIVDVVISKNCTSISSYALQDCAIKTISAPAFAFNYFFGNTCQTITVTGGELNENGCQHIANNYKHLKTLDLSATSNTTLADEAFKDCYNMETLQLPNPLQIIPYMAIAGCVNLKSVVIPASVVEIDQRAFEDCRSLQSITFAGSQVQKIGNWAFYNAHQLQSLTLPQGIAEVGDAAFYGCAYLNNLQLPASVRKVGDNCFALCNKLQKIQITAAAPPRIEARTFYDVDRTIPVYVPSNSIVAYQAAAEWSDFTNIMTITAEEQVMDEEEVVVAPEMNQVVITWPKTEEASTYELVLKKDDVVVCTLTFNNEGQMLSVAYAAPGRGGISNTLYADDQITGYRFAIDGLEAGVNYTYVITALDTEGETIPTYCYSDNFRTQGGEITSLDKISSSHPQTAKVLRNGQLLILREGKVYAVDGSRL